MKKARNAISKKEVKDLLADAIEAYKKYRGIHRLGQYIWVKMFRSNAALNREAIGNGLNIFENDAHIPAFLNFITKEDEV
jgi:hypothetical protein